jgi:hypothetical protein
MIKILKINSKHKIKNYFVMKMNKQKHKEIKYFLKIDKNIY